MVRAALLVVAVGCSIYTDKPSVDEPAATSHVEAFEIPVAGPTKLDLLFVIDDSPAMAAVRDHVLANMPAFATKLTTAQLGFDLHVGVVTADAADRGVLRTHASVVGGFLVDQPQIDGEHQRNFDGTLADALVALGDVGTAGASTTPLPLLAPALALTTNAGFWRGGYITIVIITNGDDASDARVEDLAHALKSMPLDPADVVVSVIAPQDTPRLQAFLAQFPNRSTFVSIEAADLSPAITLDTLLKTDLGVKCFDSVLVEPFDCSMSEHAPSYDRAVAPCDGANQPCWRIEPDPFNCIGANHDRLAIDRDRFPPAGDVLVGQCVVN